MDFRRQDKEERILENRIDFRRRIYFSYGKADSDSMLVPKNKRSMRMNLFKRRYT